MKPFVILALVMMALALIRLVRSPLRRGIFGALAVAWGAAASASHFGIKGLYLLSGIGFVTSLILGLTWKRRALKQIERLAGITPERKAEFEAQEAREKVERLEREKQESEAGEREEAFRKSYRVERWREPIPLELNLDAVSQFIVSPGGQLEMGPGEISILVEADVIDEEDEETRPVQFTTTVCDLEGQGWQAISLVPAVGLLGRVLGFHKGNAPKLTSWKNAPEEWRKVFRECTLAIGATDLLDSRDYYEIQVDDRLLTIPEKYQGPRVDLAWDQKMGRFLVRVEGLYHSTEEDPMQEVPPFLFVLAPTQLLLPSVPALHFRKDADLIEEEPGEYPVEFTPRESGQLPEISANIRRLEPETS